MNQALQLPARAKLNLVLRVVGRRADGYHLLETLFHPLDLHDDVVVAPTSTPGVQLAVTAASDELRVSAGPDNLVCRALQALRAAVGYPGGFEVRLHKRIPAGGGLGGGSSDAAAALRLGNELLGAPLDPVALARVAVQLGADVPFFLRGGSQWGRGIGDELTAAKVLPCHFVLVLPPFGCPTVDVYKTFARLWQHSGGLASVPSITVPDTGVSAVRIACHNDLEPAAELVRPQLADLRCQIVKLGFADVRMTGSGSTLFLAWPTAAEQLHCRQRLAASLPGDVRLLLTASGPPGVDSPCPPERPAER